MQRVEIKEFLKIREQKIPVIDVRTPAEYYQGHIVGAINVPLFSNDERAEIGTLYMKKGHDEAVLKGLEFVGPKMRDIAETSRNLSLSGEIGIYCWRGGMRSASVAWLLETAGLKTFVLEGGYKSYRRNALETMIRSKNIVLIGGPTGSGKTEVLHELCKMGYQYVDLEGLASHKGSAFGALGQKEQPTNETMSNNLFESIRSLTYEQPLFVENESKAIGKLFVPDEFWEQMLKAPIIALNPYREVRVKRLVRDYACFSPDELSSAVTRITKRMGGQATTQALEAIASGRLQDAVDIVLDYYDRTYNYSLNSVVGRRVIRIDCQDKAPEIIAKMVVSEYYQNKVKFISEM